ncbi:cation transport regulator ChaB [Plantactinospora sp. KBS50]|nr:cation transport regulator ChaB [Plantactinospora sp. KBS50]
MPGREVLPSTLRRSDRKAQETWIKTHDSAVATYGEGQRAHRTAFAAVKNTHEKVGDHWEPKRRRGPSDAQAAGGGPARRAPTAGGVDANAPKEHLMAVARKLDVPGRSRMTKGELVTAIQKVNNRRTTAARGRSASSAARGRNAGSAGRGRSAGSAGRGRSAGSATRGRAGNRAGRGR